MLDVYCNQTITLKKVSSTNDSNEKTYTSSSISARFVYKVRIIRINDEESYKSEAYVITESTLNKGDVVTYDNRDWKVRHIYPYVDLNGNVIGYEGVL